MGFQKEMECLLRVLCAQGAFQNRRRFGLPCVCMRKRLASQRNTDESVNKSSRGIFGVDRKRKRREMEVAGETRLWSPAGSVGVWRKQFADSP